MASRPLIGLLVATTVVAAACTTNTEIANLTTPSDVFAPTPSIGASAPPTTENASPPTTRADVEMVEIVRVDPLTLEPLPGLEPIPMGDWTWGVSSDNGAWLALYAGQDSTSLGSIRLVDVEQWRVTTEWESVSDSPLAVTDDGTVYVHDYPTAQEVIVELAPGAEPGTVWEIPIGFSAWSFPLLTDERLVAYGQWFEPTTVDNPGPGPMALLTADRNGDAIISPLYEVGVGTTSVFEFDDGVIGVLDTSPAVVWDASNETAIVVDGASDNLTVFAIGTGESTTHRFGPDGELSTDPPPEYPENVDLWAGSWRTAVLSDDGDTLFVAGNRGEFVDVDGVPTSVTTPHGVTAIDTDTWEVVAQSDVPVSEIHISRDGTRLVGFGQREESSANDYRYESSGVYILDPSDLEVVAHIEPETTQMWFGPVSFAASGNVAHIGGMTGIMLVDLEDGEILQSIPGSDVQIIGDAGVLSRPASLDG